MNLGLMYEQGRYVHQSKEEALKCFKHAADLGDATARELLKTKKLQRPKALNKGTGYQDHSIIPKRKVTDASEQFTDGELLANMQNAAAQGGFDGEDDSEQYENFSDEYN